MTKNNVGIKKMFSAVFVISILLLTSFSVVSVADMRDYDISKLTGKSEKVGTGDTDDKMIYNSALEWNKGTPVSSAGDEIPKTLREKLIPFPQSIEMKGFELELDNEWVIVVDKTDDSGRYNISANWTRTNLSQFHDIHINIIDGAIFQQNPGAFPKRIILGNPANHSFVDSVLQDRGLDVPLFLEKEGYILEVFDDTIEHGTAGKEIVIAAYAPNGVFYCVQTLLQLIDKKPHIDVVFVYGVSILDYPDFSFRGVESCKMMFHSNGQVPGDTSEMNPSQAEFIDNMSKWKINFILVPHETDFFKPVNDWETGWGQLMDYARQRFIEIIPMVNTLRHNPGMKFHHAEGWPIENETFRFEEVEGEEIAVADIPCEDLMDGSGSFEDDKWTGSENPSGPAGWEIGTTSNDAIWTRDRTVNHTGNCSMKLEDTYLENAYGSGDTNHNEIYLRWNLTDDVGQNLDAEPDSYYYVTAWIKSDVNTDGNKPALMLVTTTKDDDGSYYNNRSRRDLSWHKTTTDPLPPWTINGWVKVGTTLKTPPEESNPGHIWIYTRLQNPGRGTYWIDDIEVYRLDGSLKNVIRSPSEPEEEGYFSTDIVVRNIENGNPYVEGVHYTIENGYQNLKFNISRESFKIKREGSGIPIGEPFYVSYDSVFPYAYIWEDGSGPYVQPKCVSEETLYTGRGGAAGYGHEQAYENVTRILNPKFIVTDTDEMRGFNRDSRNLRTGLTNAELLARFLNRNDEKLRSCDPDCRILTNDDMLSPYHNGGCPDYQLHFGGSPGRIAEAVEQEMVDKSVIMLVWKGGLAQREATTRFWREKGYDYIAEHMGGTDKESIVDWSELVVGKPGALGGMNLPWDGAEACFQTTADHFWNTRQKMVYFENFEVDDNNDGIPDGDDNNDGVPDGWYTDGDTEYNITGAQDQGDEYAGWPKCAVKVTGGSSKYYSDLIPVIPDTSYRFSAYIKNETEYNNNPKLALSWYDRYGGHIDAHEEEIEGVTQSYDCYEIEAVSPQTACYVRLFLFGSISGDGFWFDNIQLKIPNPLRGTTTIYVDDDNMEGPWFGTKLLPYKHIQDGIDNASIGDTVFVFNGTYHETLVVDKTINLVGESREDTIIDGGPSEDEEYDFTFVWMTDTQYYSEEYPDIYDNMTRWIADNKDSKKIKYVIHTGDIVQNYPHIESEWENASHSMGFLERNRNSVPYGILSGNHDQMCQYDEYFGPWRFENEDHYGGNFGGDRWNLGDNENHYDLISVGGVDFIILYLSWDIYDEEFNWANDTLSAYSDRHAIIAVHEYINTSGVHTYIGMEGCISGDGINIYNNLVIPNDNVFMILCGHIHSAKYNIVNIAGRTVYEILADYQNAPDGGSGYMRLLHFDANNDEIYVKTYSPYLDDYNYFRDDEEEFDLDFVMQPDVVFVSADGVSIRNFTIQNADNVGINIQSDHNAVQGNIIIDNKYGICLYNNASNNNINENTITYNNQYGLYMENASINIISKNTITNSVNSIYLYKSSDNIISENSITDNSLEGIHLENSSSNYIFGNMIANNLDNVGISLLYSSLDNTISKNDIINNAGGVSLCYSSNNNRVYHNYFNNTYENAFEAESCNIWDGGYPSGGNYWSDFDQSDEGAYDSYQGENQDQSGADGIVDQGVDEGGGLNPYTIPGGSSQDRYPLMYPWYNGYPDVFVDDNADPSWYDSGHVGTIQEGIDRAIAGVSTVYVCSGTYFEHVSVDKQMITLLGEDMETTIIDGGGSGDVVNISADWVNISGFTIQNSGNYGGDVGAGICVASGSNIVSGNLIKDNYYGIHLVGSSNGEIWEISNNRISGNIIKNNNEYEIFLSSSSGNLVSGNTITNNRPCGYEADCGIYLYESYGNKISENVISSNYSDVYIGGSISLWYSSHNTIDNNNITNNVCGWGIRLSYSSNNSVIRNNIENNGAPGLALKDSDDNTISQNTIKNHYGYGISIYGSSENNHIYHNNFIDNNDGDVQAYDTDMSNIWNDSYPSGNYWNDFDQQEEGAFDNNGDGIVDTPYNISPGIVGNQDRYPLVEPYGWTELDWWPMFRHDPAQTGYTTSVAPDTNNLLWEHSLGWLHMESPVVYNSKVYVGSNKLYCLDAETGDEIWNYPTEGGVHSVPAVADDKVYIGSSYGKVYCLNAETGSYIWDRTIGEEGHSSSPTVVDDKVYIGSNVPDDNVYCLDADDGHEIWTYPIDGPVYLSPAVADGKVYVTKHGGIGGSSEIHCLHASNGTYIWSSLGYSHVIADDKIYTTTTTGYMPPFTYKIWCRDAATGNEIWSNTLDSGGPSLAVAYGKVYIGLYGTWPENEGSVSCFDAETGDEIWNKPTGSDGSSMLSSLAIADNKIYVGSKDDKIYCLNAENGNNVWSYTTDGDVYPSPAIADGKVYIGSSDGNVYCFGDN